MRRIVDIHPLQPETNEQAVRQTGAVVLTYDSQLCDVYYHSTCGGFTADGEGVWADKNIPYLRSVDDRDRCSMSPHFRWHLQVAQGGLFDEEFHIQVGRGLDWNTIKSANFVFSKNGKTWEFSGKGLGHGVGLCQFGTCSLAQSGKNYREILAIYFSRCYNR